MTSYDGSCMRVLCVHRCLSKVERSITSQRAQHVAAKQRSVAYGPGSRRNSKHWSTNAHPWRNTVRTIPAANSGNARGQTTSGLHQDQRQRLPCASAAACPRNSRKKKSDPSRINLPGVNKRTRWNYLNFVDIRFFVICLFHVPWIRLTTGHLTVGLVMQGEGRAQAKIRGLIAQNGKADYG